MKNTYGVGADGATVIINTKEGTRNLHVDRADIGVLEDFDGTWGMSNDGRGNEFVRGNGKLPFGARWQPILVQLLLKPQKGEKVVYLDGNPLNCCRKNLAVVKKGTTDAEIEALRHERLNHGKPAKASICEVIDLGEGRQGLLKDGVEIAAVKGVHYHSGKKKWEAAAFWGGKGHSKRQFLGYWPLDQLEAANAAVVFFRENGPIAYKNSIHFKGDK
jgi:hypothetical protein